MHGKSEIGRYCINSTGYKKRPALIIADTKDGDVIVCRITGKFYDSQYDIKLNDWKKYGLKIPSVIRVHKIVALELDLIELKLGRVSKDIQTDVKHIIHKFM